MQQKAKVDLESQRQKEQGKCLNASKNFDQSILTSDTELQILVYMYTVMLPSHKLTHRK